MTHMKPTKIRALLYARRAVINESIYVYHCTDQVKAKLPNNTLGVIEIGSPGCGISGSGPQRSLN